ncbi:MAG: hypothetical protein WDO15_05460 [Bacteroidota bacterium]
MKRKNLLPVVLMAASITLLLLLQTLWLVSSYDQAYQDVRRRTSDLFRGTIVEMRDSLFMKTFQKMSPDTIREVGGQAVFFSLNVDTVHLRGATMRPRESRAELVVAGEDYPMPKKIVVRFDTDSLNQDSLIYHYKKALTKQGIDLTFTLRLNHPLSVVQKDMIEGEVKTTRKIHKRFGPSEEGPIVTDKSRIATEWMFFGPNLRYAVIFDNIRPYIYLQIAPQILFSVGAVPHHIGCILYDVSKHALATKTDGP